MTAERGQQRPERLVLSCVSCLVQPHIKSDQIVYDILSQVECICQGDLLQYSTEGWL